MHQLWQRLKGAWESAGNRLSGRGVPTLVAGSSPVAPSGGGPSRLPAADVYENDSELILCADVPGASPDTTTLEVHCRSLTLHARAGDAEDWHRDFEFPASADIDRARGSLEHGVLKVNIPKRPGPKPRTVPVRAA